MKFKILVIISVLITLVIGITGVVYGNEMQLTSEELRLASTTGLIDPNDYKPGSMTEVENANHLFDIGNMVVSIVRIIASIISVVVLLILGIKYMLGSVEEKAEYKKSMMPYVIGAVLVFGITNILAIIIDIVTTIV